MTCVQLQNVFGRRIFQYIAALSGTLGVISSEMHYGWPSAAIPSLVSGEYKIKISDEEGSWLAVILFAGTLTGSIVGPFINEFTGRKTVILIASGPLLIGWLMIGFAKTIIVIFVARFIAGISDGLCFSTVPIYLGEIAEPKIRGMLSSICPVFIVSGILLANILGNYVDLDTAAFISSVLPVLQIATFIWMPESPTYLLLKGHYTKAEKSLHTLRGESEGDAELERLTDAYIPECETNTKFTELILELFTIRSNRRALYVHLVLRCLHQLCGATAITFYSKTIFEEAKDILPSDVGTIMYFSLQVLMALIASFIIDVFGRRPLLIASAGGSAISLFTLGFFTYINNRTDIDATNFTFVPILGLLSFVAFYSIGIQIMPFLTAGEIFSSRVKSFAAGLGNICYSILAILTSKFFHVTNEAYGTHVPFFSFGSFCIIGLVWCYFYLPETKGKTLEDIQEELREEFLKNGKFFNTNLKICRKV